MAPSVSPLNRSANGSPHHTPLSLLFHFTSLGGAHNECAVTISDLAIEPLFEGSTIRPGKKEIYLLCNMNEKGEKGGKNLAWL